MAAEGPGRGQLPPPPLSEGTDATGFEDLRVPWMTPLYTAVAYLIPEVAHALSTGRVVQASVLWTALPGVFMGLCLVGADRWASGPKRIARWALGGAVGAALTCGLGTVLLVAHTGATPQAIASPLAVLQYGYAILTWALLGGGCGAAGDSLRGVWWKLPAVGAGAFLIGEGVMLAGSSLIYGGFHGHPPLWIDWLTGSVVPSLSRGALLGLALAAALVQASRASAGGQTPRNGCDGPGNEVTRA